MAYNDIVNMAHDNDLRLRIVAAAAQEQDLNPGHWTDLNLWHVVSAPRWAEAYAYAKASSNERPGYDEAVITDTMILAAVQARVDATAG